MECNQCKAPKPEGFGPPPFPPPGYCLFIFTSHIAFRTAISGASDVCVVNVHMLSSGIQVVTVVVVDQVGCVAAVVWNVEGQGDPAAFVGAEVWTVEASEEGVAWTEAVLEEEVAVALLWMTWEEGGEEWDHLAKWI